MFVETSAPEWVPKVSEIDFSSVVTDLSKGRKISRIGVAGSNIFPHPIFENLREAVGGAEIVPADDVILKVRSIKK